MQQDRTTSPHIAFLSIPAHGHVHPGLGLVSELVHRGFRVTYATTEHFAELVREAGATPVLYDSVLPHPTGTHQEWPTDPVEAQRLFLREMRHVVPQLRDVFGADVPNLVIYDTAAMAALVLGPQWGVPIVQLSPTHVYYEGIEEEFGDAASRIDAAIRSEFDAYFAGEGVDSRYDDIGHPRRCLVTIPRSFQYHGERVAEKYSFVGPLISSRDLGAAWVPSVRPLLVVSLGSAYNERPDVYRACCEAFGDSGWDVLMSVGRQTDIAELGEIPRNVQVRRWIPQFHALAAASAFITHAGMGGTMEALYQGVPMVAIPQAAEQFLNAARIQQLGVGVHLNSGVSPQELCAAVSTVLTDDRIQTQVHELRNEVRSTGGAEPAADMIEAEL